MDYRWFGALHLIAAVVWISGMLLLAIVARLYAGKRHDTAQDSPFLTYVRVWNRKVTSPAMLLLWLFGAVLVVKNGDILQPWLLAKLFILVFLSAIHGKLSKTIRQLATHQPVTPGFFTRHAQSLIIFFIAVIILLAKFRASLM